MKRWKNAILIVGCSLAFMSVGCALDGTGEGEKLRTVEQELNGVYSFDELFVTGTRTFSLDEYSFCVISCVQEGLDNFCLITENYGSWLAWADGDYCAFSCIRQNNRCSRAIEVERFLLSTSDGDEEMRLSGDDFSFCALSTTAALPIVGPGGNQCMADPLSSGDWKPSAEEGSSCEFSWIRSGSASTSRARSCGFAIQVDEHSLRVNSGSQLNVDEDEYDYCAVAGRTNPDGSCTANHDSDDDRFEFISQAHSGSNRCRYVCIED